MRLQSREASYFLKLTCYTASTAAHTVLSSEVSLAQPSRLETNHTFKGTSRTSIRQQISRRALKGFSVPFKGSKKPGVDLEVEGTL